MKRSMMQMYVQNSRDAVAFYQKAFGASVGNEYKNPDGSYMHAELNAFGQTLAVSEAPADVSSGSNRQFCFHFEEDEVAQIQHAYEALKDGASIEHPIGECFYSKCMFSLIDRFRIHWCLFL